MSLTDQVKSFITRNPGVGPLLLVAFPSDYVPAAVAAKPGMFGSLFGGPKRPPPISPAASGKEDSFRDAFDRFYYLAGKHGVPGSTTRLQYFLDTIESKRQEVFANLVSGMPGEMTFVRLSGEVITSPIEPEKLRQELADFVLVLQRYYLKAKREVMGLRGGTRRRRRQSRRRQTRGRQTRGRRQTRRSGW